MATLKHDATVGRLLLMDSANLPDLTAEEFMSYINEGFVPVLYTNSSNLPGALYKFASWQMSEDGIVGLSSEGAVIVEFYPRGYVPEEPNEEES